MNLITSYLVYVLYLHIIIIHVIASIQDVKTREISDWLWASSIPAVILCIYIVFTEDLSRLYMVSVLFGTSIGLIVLFTKMMGGADAKSIIVNSLALPPLITALDPTSITLNLPSVALITNALIITLVYVVYNFVRNLLIFNQCRVVNSKFKRILYALLLTCTPVYKIFKKPHAYTLAQEFEENNKVKIKFQLKITEEDPRDKLLRWINENRITIRDYVLTNYQIPFIVYITLGLITYIITKQSIIYIIITLLTQT